MRADLVTARTAVAHAAWHGRDAVDRGRRPGRGPAGAAAPPPPQPVRRARPGRAGRSTRRCGDAEPEPEPPGRPTARTAARRRRRRRRPDGGGPGRRPGRRRATARTPERPPSGPGGRPDASAPQPARAVPPAGDGPAERSGVARGAVPRPAAHRARASARARPAAGRGPRTVVGRTVGARRPPGRAGAAAPARHRRAPPRRTSGAAAAPARAAGPRATTCARRCSEGREGNLVLFVRRRLRVDGRPAADGARSRRAVLSLLRDAYQRRDKVGLVTFRGAGRRARAAADLLGARPRPAGWPTCPPAAAPRSPRACCAAAPRPGRRTAARPAAAAPLLVVVTDGRATSRRRRRPGPGRGLLTGAGGWPGRPPWSSTARPAGSRLGLAGRLAGPARRDHCWAMDERRRRVSPRQLSRRGPGRGGSPDAAGTSREPSRTTA